MKTVSPDRSFIDYWQDYGTGRKSHFGVRVWEDRCCAITNVGSANPALLGKEHPLPVDFSETAPKHSVSNITGEHMYHHPESDLLPVLTRKKRFSEALVEDQVPLNRHNRKP